MQPQFIVYILVTATLLIWLIHTTMYSKAYIYVDLSIASLFGGYTVLSTKAISSLLNVYFYEIFTNYMTAGLLIILFASAVVCITS